MMVTNKIRNLMYKIESVLRFEAVELSTRVTAMLKLKFV